jgi:arginine/lysine/ornithine decarboxylase
MLPPITVFPPKFEKPIIKVSPQTALLSSFEEIPIENSEGRILADMNVSCPPAVPIAVCGEEITKQTINCFKYYNVKTCKVIK